MLKFYKIALGIEYNGSKYHGWQRQQDIRTVQDAVEKALSQIANERISVVCAGRTDVGVHSTGQVVHFITSVIRSNAAWTLGVNSKLPNDIVILWMKNVPDNFHARFSAVSRHYRYIIYNQQSRPAILREGLAHYYRPLDVEKMNSAAQCLVGENDFTSFRSMQCQSVTPWRNLLYIHVGKLGSYVIVDIKANAFLHRMVRNIVGSLIQVGHGRQSERWILELLSAKSRILLKNTVKSKGLYLVSIDYPEYLNFPKLPVGPLFLINYNI